MAKETYTLDVKQYSINSAPSLSLVRAESKDSKGQIVMNVAIQCNEKKARELADKKTISVTIE